MMPAMVDLLDDVVSRLRDRRQKAWREVAALSGVPFSTVQKVAYAVSRRPQVQTVVAIKDALDRLDGRAPKQRKPKS